MIKTRAILEGKSRTREVEGRECFGGKTATICVGASTREPENSMGVEDKLVKMVQ
jgi:hypothetical protein